MAIPSSSDPSSAGPTRKNPTYGGSRAWSEEEETFLLQSRQRKTPYKHIATYLQKTELACRLHYHQLAYGTKRKHRCNSASSNSTSFGGSNISMANTTRGHTPEKSSDSTHSYANNQPSTMARSNFSPPSSPRAPTTKRLARSESPSSDHQLLVPTLSMTSASAHIPSREQFSPFGQLPRLAYNSDTVMAGRRGSSCSLERTFTPLHNLNLPSVSVGPVGHHLGVLQFDAQAGPAASNMNGPADFCHVDFTRLDRCYQLHKHTFWASVAREYGAHTDPLILEAAYLRHHAPSPVNSLPTPPNRSPILLPTVLAEDVESGRVIVETSNGSAQPIKTVTKETGSSCSIASILTEDQEVWSRRRQTV